MCLNASAQQDSGGFRISPNHPWADISHLPQDSRSESSSSSKDDEGGGGFLDALMMYIPNRFLDLVDIFKADVGVGPSVGAVVRVTKYGQVGLRAIAPMSARLGLLGRRAPAMLETSSEMGIGPAYKRSKDRKVCWGEVGAGVDLILVGGYLGACPDELVDFVAGIFFLDLKGDDL